MSTALVASTPSPPPRIRTPQTPRFGYADPWEPYSPRKSARISSQKSSVARTPSPKHPQRPSTQHHLTIPTPRTTRTSYHSTTMSPAPSPTKKKTPAPDAVHRLSGQLTAESTVTAADSLGITSKTQSRSARATASGLLPTPAKTPSRKHPSAENEANIAAFARNLFHGDNEASLDTKKKRAKKYSGLTLDSFTALDDEDPIKIFTDSHDRVPEVDEDADNPFYSGRAAAPVEPTKRRSKRSKVTIPGEGRATVEEATRREDGLVYVFRGKKIFRKFEHAEEASASDEAGTSAEEPRKRVTRSLKPRLLFPVKPKETAAQEEEEADTDIEESVEEPAEEATPEQDQATPAAQIDEAPDTPTAPKYAPASPPTTSRTTRSGHKTADDLTPVKASRPGKRSPFDGWRHTKSSSANNHKRAGEDLGAPAPTKRPRA